MTALEKYKKMKKIHPRKIIEIPKKKKNRDIYVIFIAILLFVYVQEKVQILLSTCIIPNCIICKKCVYFSLCGNVACLMDKRTSCDKFKAIAAS